MAAPRRGRRIRPRRRDQSATCSSGQPLRDRRRLLSRGEGASARQPPGRWTGRLSDSDATLASRDRLHRRPAQQSWGITVTETGHEHRYPGASFRESACAQCNPGPRAKPFVRQRTPWSDPRHSRCHQHLPGSRARSSSHGPFCVPALMPKPAGLRHPVFPRARELTNSGYDSSTATCARGITRARQRARGGPAAYARRCAGLVRQDRCSSPTRLLRLPSPWSAGVASTVAGTLVTADTGASTQRPKSVSNPRAGAAMHVAMQAVASAVRTAEVRLRDVACGKLFVPAG